jgi:glycosyltransferase involved in cell wall biosynthesis
LSVLLRVGANGCTDPQLATRGRRKYGGNLDEAFHNDEDVPAAKIRKAGEFQMMVIVIPAYNEERFIGSVVLKARKFADTVVVVDDGSSDATGEIAGEAGALVERHALNQGKGGALNTGFRKARELGAQIVVVLDGDGQHSPGEIPKLIAPIEKGEADMVIGSRYLDRRSAVPRSRVFGHRVITFLTNFASGRRVTDSQSGFRAFSAHAIDEIAFTSRSFSVESEMQFLANRYSLRLMEVPVIIHYPDTPKRSAIMQGLLVVNGILRLAGQHRPLLFFGVSGVVVLLAGLLWGAYVVEIYNHRHVLATGYALISVLLSIIGTLSFFTGIILYSIRGLITEIKEEIKR